MAVCAGVLAAWTAHLLGASLAHRDDCRSTLVLWAWERAEDVRFLDARCTAVAWFAGQADVAAGAVSFTPRQQDLKIQPTQANWPVVRVDAHGSPPVGEQDDARRRELQRQLARFLSAKQLAHGLQIDFDAPRSWRPWYASLLADLQPALPPGAPLTMTALASWCLGDPWLRESTAVAYAVPMLFRMGPDGAGIRRALAADAGFRWRKCEGSVGVSLDESAPERLTRSAARVYVFAPRAWTPELVDRAYALTGAARPVRVVRVTR